MTEKKSEDSTEQKRQLIQPAHANISVSRQCDLLNLPRSSYYFKPTPDSDLTLTFLILTDEELTRHPFIGTRKMGQYLNSFGYNVNRKRIQHYYQLLELETVYCKPNTSKAHPDHKIYTYLPRHRVIDKPNQVYCADITYIRIHQGFMYLVAIMDWFSRYVLG